MRAPDNPSVLLNSAGPHAAEIAGLFTYFLAISAIILLLVIGAYVVIIAWRRSRSGEVSPPLEPDAREPLLRIFVGAAIAVSVLVLVSFVGLSYAVDRRLIELDRQADMEIDVWAHQWWWELRYRGAAPGDTFYTANEIHVPVGKSVRLKLKSSDVIHSIWLPNIAGKTDIIPGLDRELVIRVDKQGVWRGRCSEFCGQQHAFMGLTLFADTPETFDAWLAAQRKPALEPRTDEERHGQELFISSRCGLCHTIRGTAAGGQSSSAPDLTHLKSRSTIAAGTAPNSKGHLGGWIVDPHGIKPGVRMPATPQDADDFQALLAYLETLE